MTIRAALAGRGERLAPRERRVVGAGAIVVVGALAWAYAWHPLVQDLPRAKRDAERAQARLAAARESASVGGTRAAAPARAPIEAAIRSALATSGADPATASLDVSGPRAALTLPSVPFAALVGLVDALAREQAIHVVEATITARVEPGRVRAELSLAR